MFGGDPGKSGLSEEELGTKPTSGDIDTQEHLRDAYFSDQPTTEPATETPLPTGEFPQKWTEEKIKETLELIFQYWLNDQNPNKVFNPTYIESRNKSVAKHIRNKRGGKYSDFLNQDALKYFVKKEIIDWTDQLVRSTLLEIFETWKKEEFPKPPEERFLFNPTYISNKNRALYIYIHDNHAGNIKDFLPEYAQTHFTRGIRKKRDESIIEKEFLTLFDKWKAEELTKPETERRSFNPSYFEENNKTIVSYLRSRKIAATQYSRFLPEEAKQYFETLHYWTENELNEAVAEVFQKWKTEELPKPESARKAFNPKYIDQTNPRVVSAIKSNKFNNIEDYLPDEAKEYFERKESSPSVERVEKILIDALEAIFQQWKAEELAKPEEDRGSFNPSYISSKNKSLYNAIYLNFDHYLSDEARIYWDRKESTRWTDENIRSALRDLFETWKKEELCKPEEERKNFNVAYIQRTRGGLHNSLSKSSRDYLDFLSPEAKAYWWTRPREWNDQNISQSLEEIFQKWKTEELVKPEEERKKFSPTYITEIESGLTSYLKKKSKSYEVFLSDEARKYWSHRETVVRKWSDDLIENALGDYFQKWKKEELIKPEADRIKFSPRYISKQNQSITSIIYNRKDGDFDRYLSDEAKQYWDKIERIEWTPEKFKDSLEEIFQGWKKEELPKKGKKGKKFCSKYIDNTNRALYGAITKYNRKNKTKLEDFLSGEAKRYLEKLEKWSDEQIKSVLEGIFQKWKVEEMSKSESEGKKFTPIYIESSNQKVYGAIRHRKNTIEDYLSDEAKKYWSKAEQATWDEESIKNKFEEHFQKWKREELSKSAKERRKFNPKYLDTLGRSLISTIYNRKAKFEDYLSDEAKIYWEKSGNWDEEKISNEIDAIFAIWRNEELPKIETERKKFNAEYVRQYNMAIPHQIRRYYDNDYLRFLSPEAQPYWSYLSRIKNENIEASILEFKNSDQLEQLIGMFGSSKIVDILYATHPEFSGIKPEYLNGIIADYLGDFLATPQEFRPGNINQETVRCLETSASLQEGLLEVIKDGCLQHYNQRKKTSNGRSDLEIISEYLDEIRKSSSELGSDILNRTIEKAADYWHGVLSLEKPSNIVDSLKEKRSFPDINQKINIYEISTKQRILIADEMGLGKSASAILTREHLSAEREAQGLPPLKTLIAVPSNVIATWERYLSDNERGYFRSGQAPKVLVLENESAGDFENYDYVLVSQERLNESTTGVLTDFDWGYVIFDEIHKLKNIREGVRASNALRLADKISGEGKYLALLSGTPVPNKVEDIAVILKMLYPDQFGDTDNRELISQILHGDIISLRSLLVPRMQMKELAESLDMPELNEEVNEIILSPEERIVYEALLEDDEVTASEKMQLLRKFLINPSLIEVAPEMKSTKLASLKEQIHDGLEKKDKIVVYINGFVEDVIRGEQSIISDLGLPKNIHILTIHGQTSPNDRATAEWVFNTKAAGKTVMFVSGQTADVGVDFSGGEEIIFFNEPWTRSDYRQQRARVYREGLDHPLDCSTMVTRDSIEEGIHLYTLQKERAIGKLLRGIPITELDRELLLGSENQGNVDLEVTPELARFYLSSYDRIMKIFNYVKRQMGSSGEEGFKDFLKQYSKEYAGCYTDIGSRSYQGNSARICGEMIKRFAEEQGKKKIDTRILDIASGPEMLKRHIDDDLKHEVFSLDINKEHFADLGENRAVGSAIYLPFTDKTFDYTNFSFAFHYLGFLPSKGVYDRVQALIEMNRVLKDHGRALINNIYSAEIKDFDSFKNIVELLGFKVVERYTGQATSNDNFASNMITLEKVTDVTLSPEDVAEISREFSNGMKIRDKDMSLKNQRRIISNFEINGENLNIDLNEEDKAAAEEEMNSLAKAEELKKTHGSLENIPPSELVENNFARYKAGKNYKLLKRMQKGGGAIIIS